MTTDIEKVRVRVFGDGSWQFVNGMMDYIPEIKKATVVLPVQFSFPGLINYLTWKLNLPDLQNRFRLTYKSLSSGSIVELLNTEDVRNFLAIGVEISPHALKLYVCDRGDGSHQSDPQHILPLVPYEPNPRQDEPYQTQYQPSFQPYETQYQPSFQPYQTQYQSSFQPYQSQFQPSFQPYQPSFQPYQSQFQQSFQNPYEAYQPQYQSFQNQGMHENRNPYQYEDLPSDYGIRISEVPAEEFDAYLDDNENASHKYKVDIDPYYGAVCGDCLYHPNTDEYLGIQSDGSAGDPEEEDDEDDEESDEELPKDGGNIPRPTGSNLFWGMPPPLPTPVPIVKPKEPAVNYQPSKRVKVEQIFKCKNDLKLALGLKCLEECYQMRISRSTRKRFEAVCLCKRCEWRIRATVIKDTKLFQVRIFKDIHTCSRTQVYPNHRQANKKVLGHILKDAMNDTSRVYKSHDIIADMKNNYKISVSYMQAWRAKCYALHLLRGNPEESFSLLPVYCYNLEKANPGTVWKIQTDEMTRFERFFVAIGCAVRKNILLLSM